MVKLIQKKTAKQRAWESIISFRDKPFTVGDIYKRCPTVPKDVIGVYLNALCKEKIVTRISKDKPMVYQLLKSSLEAPLFNAKGKLYRPYCRQDNLWRSMKMLKEFNSKILAEHASNNNLNVSQEQARSFCNELTKVGIVKKIEEGKTGKKLAIYKLIKDLGGQPPVIKKIPVVYDMNSGQVFLPLDMEEYS